MFKKIMTAIAVITVMAACQEEKESYMTLSDKDMAVDAEGGKLSFTLSSNTFVRVNNDMEWATLTQGESQGDATTYSLDVQANTETKPRVGTIRFIGDKVTPLKFTLTQKALVPVGVDPKEISVGYSKTSATFTVLGEKDWTASCDNSSFTLSPASGTGETTVPVSFPENSTYKPVVATVTVTLGSDKYTCTITQGAAPAQDYIDLSASQTANCYIIDKVGYYKFKADVRGNGVVPASLSSKFGALEPKSVIALWSSFNTTEAPASADAFINTLNYEDGYVTFFVPEEVTGNMVIAALDKDGAIIWSWHLWFTPVPADIKLASASWMDRNLGAVTAAQAGSDATPATVGFFYSWGRKDPMRSLASYTPSDTGEPVFIATANQGSRVWEHNTDVTGEYLIGKFIAEPMKYYEDKGKFWVAEDGSTKLTDLWGNDKTMFDPCPAGYKVPSKDQLVTLASDSGIPTTAKKSAGADYTDNYSDANHYFKFSSVVLPLGGAYTFNNAGNVVNAGTDGRYCSSSYNTSTNCYWININTSAYNVNNSGACTQGGMVRCIKE